MPAPSDLATRETLTFVTSHLPRGASLLEVGCGEGQLALELQELDYKVVGLESDRERACVTSRRGVPCVLAAWPMFESTVFDAIAFTRSLHHIEPLAESVAQARTLLHPSGVLLIEDFAVHEVSKRDLDWVCEVIRSSTARSLLIDAPDELVSQLRDSSDPIAVWTERHDHVHRFDAVESAVRKEFAIAYASTVPYFYRYFVYVLPPTEAAAKFLKTLFEEELRLITSGEIVGLGRRIVGAPRLP
ncbi:MAG TPA: methyltransferase domain-containing protein [Candidatus Eisenbacteria bacterium]|nr:methyltransferase domain-containing protein [Candidatus Eisenbacteria bacterium]